MESVIINGVKYVGESQKSETLDGMEYKLIRSEKAGVFAGYLEKREGTEVVLRKARRIWYWTGAATLSQLAEEGTKTPKTCKFPQEVDRIVILGVIEISDVTEQARISIQGVPVWKK